MNSTSIALETIQEISRSTLIKRKLNYVCNFGKEPLQVVYF